MLVADQQSAGSNMKKNALVVPLLAAAALVGVIVWSIWWWSQQRSLGLLEAKTVGLGYLEGENYSEALPYFERIVRELPEEPLGHRNLTISLLIAQKTEPNPRTKEQIKA